MKLIDFLKVMDNDSFIFLNVSVWGMQFETRHTAEFFIKTGGDLNNKEIEKAYVLGDGLHVRLKE